MAAEFRLSITTNLGIPKAVIISLNGFFISSDAFYFIIFICANFENLSMAVRTNFFCVVEMSIWVISPG